MSHRFTLLLGAACLLAPLSLSPVAVRAADPHPRPGAAKDAKPDAHDDAVSSDGSVTVGGVPISYQAVIGTLLVHPKGWDDAAGAQADGPDLQDSSGDAAKGDSAGGHDKDAEARMSYVAYFKHSVAPGTRPITFLYNGGPGSSTVWLHMGAFGPRRAVTANAAITPPAPFGLANNDDSLLDASDLVFIDAPGTGFGRITGKDKEKAFWGTDQDAYAFSQFIVSFLTKYGRWNSPKYLFGESYGTMRSAVLSNMLQQDEGVGLNGVILLSQIFDYTNSIDGTKTFPGEDMPYVLALPSYAATAWYHQKLPDQTNNPSDLPALLGQVEHFASNDYLLALAQGASLPDADRDRIADQLHRYTGLPLDYIKRAGLRIEGDEFAHELMNDTDTTTGRLDSRYAGPSMDPLDRGSQYDPLDAGIDAAFTADFNDYARTALHWTGTLKYKTEIDVFKDWDNKHQPPGADSPLPAQPNVLGDLAAAMKYNPTLKVQLNAGYFDIGTPFYEGLYEMSHLPMPRQLQTNIEEHQYASGHMVYLNDAARRQLHDNVAAFIRANAHQPAPAPAH